MQDTPQAEASRILNLARRQIQGRVEAGSVTYGDCFDVPEPRLKQYTVQDFFCTDPREAVIRTYILLFGRRPGPEELGECLGKICSGTRLSQLIWQLRQSLEGSEHPVRISGLHLARLADRHRGNRLVSAIGRKLGVLPPQLDTRGYPAQLVDSTALGTQSPQ